MPVVESLGDRRCDKRTALIQFYLPAKGERREIVRIFYGMISDGYSAG